MTRPTPWALGAAALAWFLFAPGWWRPVQDPDLWWLVWAGEQGLPGVNALSWTAPEQPWTLHEPVVALAYGAVGPHGVGWVRGLVLSLLGLLTLDLSHRKARGWTAPLALLWLLPGLSIALSERPMAWALLSCALLLVGLRRGRPAVALAAVLAWSVCHGSFPVGVALLLLFRPAWGLAALAVTLSLRWEIWELSWAYLWGQGSLGLVHAHILEWGPLRPDSPPQALRLLALLFGAAVLASGRSRERLLILLLPLALLHWRMCALVSLAWLPFVADRFAAWTPQRGGGRPLPLLAGALALTPLFVQPRLSEPVLPVVGERIYNDLVLGGWLGYRGLPVFWDARNDCYPQEVYADGLRVAYGLDGWERVLDERRVDTVVTRDPALAERLAAWPRSQSAGLFVLRRPPAAARLPTHGTP